MIKASLLLACKTLLLLSSNFSCCWRRGQARKKGISAWDKKSCFGDVWAESLTWRKTIGRKGEKQPEDGCRHCQSCVGQWELVPTPLGLNGTRPSWDCGWTALHQEQHPVKISSTAATLFVRVSALQCCSGMAAGHTGLLSALSCLPDAVLASATLQPLTRCHLSACPGPRNPNLPCTGTHFTHHPCPGLEVELGFPWTFSASGVGVAV